MIGGCAQPTDLQPASPARTVPAPGPEAGAVDTASGVRVVAIASDWPGPAPIKEEVTPMKVRIENNSGNRVLVRYSEIALVSPAGAIYQALPLSRIESTVSKTMLSPGYRPVTTPGFVGTGFAISPLYSPLYPGYPVADGDFFYDPLYYSYYGSYWRPYELPTEAMAPMALPEGVLNPDGRVEGYLYFQEVSADVPRVQFRMDVVNAKTGQAMGEITIPFVVS